VDLVVTSPPYDDLRTYGGHSWNFETLAAQLVRVLKPGGVIVWVVADATVNGSETLTSMRQAIHFKDVCGLNVHDTMIYRKLNYTPLTHNRYEQEWEYIFVMRKGKENCFNPLIVPLTYAGQKTWGKPKLYKDNSGELTAVDGYTISDEKLHGNIFEYRVGSTQTGGIDHPAMFPETLARDFVTTWSNPGELVLDPFCGSGTTPLAAKELNREWVGVELNPKYCAIAEGRLSQDVLKLETCAMRPNTQLGN
jgi:site-specific DNA-methyltransferase (adenine-specific)